MNSTNNLKSFQNVNEGTYNNSEKDKNDIRPVGHKPKKSTADPITTDVNYETSCPICLEKLNDPHIVPECCHRFCKGCIEEALEYRRECPICRGRVTSRRALRRDEVFSKLVHLLDVERAKANTNSVSTIDDVDQLSNDAVASDNHQTETMEKNERIYVSTGAQNKEQADGRMTADTIHPALGSIDEEPMAEVDISFVKTPLDAINVVESTQKVCVEEKEETLGQTKDDDDVMNENNEAKLQGNAIKDQLQHINKERKYLEIQLEKKNNKIRAIDKVVRNLSDEHKIESMAAAVNDLQSQLQQKNHSIYGLQTQLQQKNYRLYNLHSKLQQNYHRIQHLESRGKADKENSRCVSKTIEDLVTEVEEKKTRISALEKLLRTLSDVHKIESMAAAAREVESQLQEKNDRVQQLESRQKEDEDRLWHVSKANEQLEKQLEEKNLRINYLQTLLEEKNDRIQDLELRGKADEEKLQCLNKTSEHLETQLEEKNTRIDVLEELARTLGDEHEIESMAAAVKDLQSQLQEKNDRIQLLESRKQKVEVIEEEKTIDLPLDFDINDMPGQAAGNETKRGSIHSKPKTPEQEFAALETSGAPLFLIKTYQLISTCSDQLAEWSDNGETFTVKDTAQFAKVEIPKYFDHNKFDSFSRQLNFYGFRKVPLKTIRVDQGTSTQGHVRFYNENFRKGKIHLMSKIKRSTSKDRTVNHAQEMKELQDKVDSLQSIIENMTHDYDLLKQQVEQLMNNGIGGNDYNCFMPIEEAERSQGR